MSKTQAALKRVLVGRPMASGELEHTLLPKVIALPVFASDPLSSNAYATQEAMLVLSLAGAAGISLIFFPITIVVVLVLAIVVSSYRQTVHAYPQGGGAYRVSIENVGKPAGLLAASALLGDYVLTVAVSVTAGVDAIVSAIPELGENRVSMAIAFVAFVTVANLRGAKESGTFFAIPTYGFVLSVYLLIVTGLLKCVGGCPEAPSAGLIGELGTVEPLSVWLILRAFAAGTTALTGVEAIADGTAAFRYPQSKNAAATLAIMGAFTISMFLGISWLADHTNVAYHSHEQRTVVAQIGLAVFGESFLFYLLQAMTAAILILAANTAYQDFPRLSSILAQDRFMPRQFRNRGDRLVFSNGIIILAVLASILIYVFDANLNELIQLYLVGVFISFTLSQTGLTLRFRRLKPEGWRRKAVRSAFGAFVTGIVLMVIAATKFLAGAWIIIAAIPVVMSFMHSVNKHYTLLTEQLRAEERIPRDRRPGNQHMVLFVPQVNAATARAIGYIRSIRPSEVRAVTFERQVHGAWSRLAPEIELETIERVGSWGKSLRTYLHTRRAELNEEDFLTVVVPEVLRSRSMTEIFMRPRMHRLKGTLLLERGVQVLDVPIVEEEIVPGIDESYEPARNYAVVLVSGVHNATLLALEYAETLRPTQIRAVSFGVDPEESQRLGDQWLEEDVPHPLEIEAAPFRSLGNSLARYLSQFHADGINRIVTVIIPEFIVSKRHHQILHGQTALIAKRHLLFQRGVVTVSVPYYIED